MCHLNEHKHKLFKKRKKKKEKIFHFQLYLLSILFIYFTSL